MLNRHNAKCLSRREEGVSGHFFTPEEKNGNESSFGAQVRLLVKVSDQARERESRGSGVGDHGS